MAWSHIRRGIRLVPWLALSLMMARHPLQASTNSASQLFTLSALPLAPVVASDVPHRVFSGPAHYAIESVVPNCSFGESGAAGDFNGDGRTELAVGLSRFKVQGRQVGAVGIFSFPAPGASPRLVSQLVGGGPSQRLGIELATMPEDIGRSSGQLVGVGWVSDTQRRTAMAKHFPGSTNGIVWQSSWDNLGTDSSGRHLKFHAADLNRDGWTDVVVASANVDRVTDRGGGVGLFAGSERGLSRQPLWSARLDEEGATRGVALLVADVNSDGWLDLLIGRPQRGNGSVSVYAGSPGGLPGTPTQVLAGRIENGAFGGALAPAGDVNGDGQSGDGKFTSTNSPQPIQPNSRWQAVAAGGRHTVALQENGTLWGWGLNFSGQLGNGTLVSANTPQPIQTNVTWKAVAAGAAHSVALRDDGTLCACGRNDSGQIAQPVTWLPYPVIGGRCGGRRRKS